ncbi:Threonine-phosphate decarboxylase [Sulfitobacter noctilucicola]|uniref:Aminotransferase n=1 Tax=Sulfitobacter noctilucicola TaxID=1342301 RepID=A0A7W6Q2J0_9RHOB|nr:threonine-phosphate decarboxylase [Sulfitobacter noctilucicola]KIN62331.1 Threonine-phosphate decarboxylase [Sulfitobacter noctilucicola]MBB4173135.1 cobalamin biosynthetic protein CobC [Sulfitobacter noctilucicola]
MQSKRDHGGNLDAAIARFGGKRSDWLDLSTGINPVSYPLPDLSHDAWTALPDQGALDILEGAARAFWSVPASATVRAVPGASSAIAHIPLLSPARQVDIPTPTYNEHAASFLSAGWKIGQGDTSATVHVHPNNPDGRLWRATDIKGALRVIDESFCDVTPDASLIDLAAERGTIVLKSFGKFWGLAGLRLGFAIGDPALVNRLSEMLGPWSVAGPALEIGAAALRDLDWAAQTRRRLQADAQRMDGLMKDASATLVGGTTLFRLYEVESAQATRDTLAKHQIWSRVFPYNPRWIRLGLPHLERWPKLEAALA